MRSRLPAFLSPQLLVAALCVLAGVLLLGRTFGGGPPAPAGTGAPTAAVASPPTASPAPATALPGSPLPAYPAPLASSPTSLPATPEPSQTLVTIVAAPTLPAYPGSTSTAPALDWTAEPPAAVQLTASPAQLSQRLVSPTPLPGATAGAPPPSPRAVTLPATMPPAPTLATATLTLAPPTPTLATATRSPAPPAPSVVARTATPGANPPLTAVAQTPAPLQGLFRAEGDAARATVIYSVGDSPSNALQVPLPWSMAFETLPGAELLLVVTDEDEGAVRCEIVVGGAVLQTEAQPSGQGEAACVADAPLQ